MFYEIVDERKRISWKIARDKEFRGKVEVDYLAKAEITLR